MIARGKFSSISRKFVFQKQKKCFRYDQIQALSEAERKDILFESLNIVDKRQQKMLTEKTDSEKDFSVIFCSIHFWLSQSLEESGEMVSALEFSAVVLALAIWQNSRDAGIEMNSGLREKVFYRDLIET
jgi:hypothetical protein